MIFDTEQFTVRGDSQYRTYCGAVRNDVEVVPRKGGTYTVPIVVPSGLFHVFDTVLKLDAADLVDRPVAFFLIQKEKGPWIFGMDRGEESADDTIYLWPYKSLPGWAKKKKALRVGR